MLCEETSVRPALRNAALPTLGKMNPWWLWFGEHRGLRKRVLERYRMKDTISGPIPHVMAPRGEPKESVDRDTSQSQAGWHG